MHTHQTALLSLLQTEPNGITMHAILYVCYLHNNPSFEVNPIHPSTSDANTCKSKNIQLHLKPSMKPTYLSSTSGRTNSQHHRHYNTRTHHAFLDANNTTQALEADYSQTIWITHHSFKQLKSYNSKSRKPQPHQAKPSSNTSSKTLDFMQSFPILTEPLA